MKEEPFEVGLRQANPEGTERRVGAVWFAGTMACPVIHALFFFFD